MAKEVYAYGGWSAQEVANKSSIGDKLVSGDVVLITGIDIAELKSFFGVGNNDVISLCQLSQMNTWSYYGPKKWQLNGYNLESVQKYPYNLDDFAGYNHNAEQPMCPLSFSVNRNASNLAQITLSYIPIEINWRDYAPSATSVRFELRRTDGSLLDYYNQTFPDDWVKNGVTHTFDYSGTETLVKGYIYMAQGATKIANLPNAGEISITINAYSGGTNVPKIFDVTLATDLANDLFTEYGYCSLLYSLGGNEQINNIGQFSVPSNGIDVDGDNAGDITGITYALYAKKHNLSNWSYVGTWRPARNNNIAIAGTLPFSVVNGDTVDIEIRYS